MALMPRRAGARPQSTADQANLDHSATCPVEALGREALDVLIAQERVQTQAFTLAKGPTRIKLDDQFELLSASQKGIECRASHMRAQSNLGAIYQVQLILNTVELLRACVLEGGEDTSAADQEVKTIERMCYSVRAYLERVGHTDARAVGADYYMRHVLDPHLMIEEALNAREGEHAV